METVEIVIYLMAAVIIGIFILQLIQGWDVTETYEDIRSLIANEKEQEFKTVEKEDFAIEILTFWELSGMCEVNKTLSINVKENHTGDYINKTYLFDQIKFLNFCSTLQSKNESCGSLEHVSVLPHAGGENIDLPAIIRMSCNLTNNTMIIKG